MKLGTYKILKLIARGGMGEVYLAEDPLLERQVALKRIRPNLLKHAVIRKRFLREASVAGRLFHPSIIPVYDIHKEKRELYYTMPYVEGMTLMQLLNRERLGRSSTPIVTLTRIFLKVCQAIAYAHKNGVLHRDIKPGNIIVGKFGEVMLLDWGIADFIKDPLKDEAIPDEATEPGLTRPGKVTGTLSYLAPERAKYEAATPQTDIYSLGAMLYQLLTLKLPFNRPTLKGFQKQVAGEILLDPQEVAPYREIPRRLAEVAKKCLSPAKSKRYRSVNRLIREIESYLEGEGTWMPVKELNTKDKADWAFQESILLAKHLAITPHPEVMEWVNVMISKEAFVGATRLETTITLKSSSQGIGLIVNLPSKASGLDESYMLWLGSKKKPGIRLFRSNIEMLSQPLLSLSPNREYTLCIERIENEIRCSLDGKEIFTYTSCLPLLGNHVGLLQRDDDLTIHSLKVFAKSRNLQVSCLAVADAFFACGDMERALTEYRRIGECFPGSSEGREALFRAGYTLLFGNKGQQKRAFEEFEALHETPSAPLEYLGKSLIYRKECDIEEEIKCFEIALRRFHNHPLLHYIQEQILFRLHESSYKDADAALHFTLLILHHMPELFAKPDHKRLLKTIEKYWTPLSFLKSLRLAKTKKLILELAYRLNKKMTLEELADKHENDTNFVKGAELCLKNLSKS